MKKIFLTSGIVALSFFGFLVFKTPQSAEAAGLTNAQIQAIMSLLQSFGADSSVLSNVQVSLSGGTPQQNNAGGFCHTFTRDFGIGTQGQVVTALTTALNKEGLLAGKSDTFDEEVAGSVVMFQSKYGIRQTGYVGPMTRAKLNALYGNCTITFPTIPTTPPGITPPQIGPAPTPVQLPSVYTYPSSYGYQTLPTDPNIAGSASLISTNKDMVFKWGANGRITGYDFEWLISITNSGSYTKTLRRMVLVHNTGGEGWATDASSANPVGKSLYLLGTTMLSAKGEVFNIYTDNLGFQLGAGANTTFYAYGYPGSPQFTGGYLLLEFTDNTSAQIRIPSSTLTPGTGGLTQTGASEEVTCLFNGNTSATNSCRSADTNAFGCSGVGSCNAVVSGARNSQITWKSTCGSYAYTIVDGFNEKAVFNCSVTTPPPQVSLTVTSPNGGEQLKKGSVYRIKWDSTGVSNVYLKLRKGTDTYYGNEGAVTGTISNQGYFDWQVPASLPDGNDYGIRVIEYGGTILDDSNTTFSIVSPNTIPTGTLSVTPSASTIVSGQLVTLNYTTHSNAVGAKLYLYCPASVTSSAGTSATNLCNTWTTFPMIPSASTFVLTNTSGQNQNVVPNFYEYLPENPNYAVGVSSQITVQTAPVVSPSPTPTPSPAP